jgi:predicted dehydrogenase
MAEALTRRQFVASSAVAGAGLVLSSSRSLAQATAPSSRIRIALIGTGTQGNILLESLVKIPEIEIVAICDIWDYKRRYTKASLKQQNIEVRDYDDFNELLAQEKDLQAAVVATSDQWHAPVSNACMKAGLHVYCEKMMSNTLEGARSMVQTMKETGKLLQIGHQRRSNPRYRVAYERLLRDGHICGQLTAAQAQWNRAPKADDKWPKKTDIPEDKLAKWGFNNMHEFRNWRWYRKYGGGMLSDLGAHQIDIFNWFLGVMPRSVIASGGLDYYKPPKFADRDWYDNAMVIYEYALPHGVVRAFYQVQTTTSAGGGYFEQFMGDEGTLKISESPRLTALYREPNAPSWKQFLDKHYIRPQIAAAYSGGGAKVDARESGPLAAFDLSITTRKALHRPHLENFFAAVRGEAKLNCPGDHAFESEYIIFKANEAIASGQRIVMNPAEFAV